MPSPIAHMSVGYAVSKLYKQPQKTRKNLPDGSATLVFFCSVIASMLPDIDAFFGIIKGDLGMYHNNATHSLLVGLVFALGIGFVLHKVMRTGYFYWTALIWINYALHVIMDCFTYDGRGAMLLWPISSHRFQAPFSLFWGVRWSNGWLSRDHVVTLVTESAFVMVLCAALHLIGKFKELRISSPGETGRKESSSYSNLN